MYLTFMFLGAVLFPVPALVRAIRNRKAPYKAVFEGIVSGGAGALLVMILASVSGDSIFDTIIDSVKPMAQALAEDGEFIRMMDPGMSEQERADFVISIYETAASLLPASICILTACVSYVEYIILSKVVRKDGAEGIPMEKFRNFELPGNTVIGWLILFGLAWITSKTEIVNGEMLFANINTLFNFVFCLQGISLLFMLCYIKKAPKGIAVIIILLLMFSGTGKMVLMILGFADLIFRLKEKMRRSVI